MENGEITCFYFDKDMKRLFLDDGRIKKFKLSKGTFIKEFSQHNKDVVNIMFVTKLNMVVSISSDQMIKFHTDEELLETNVIKEVIIDPLIMIKSKEKLILKYAILDEPNTMIIIILYFSFKI